MAVSVDAARSYIEDASLPQPPPVSQDEAHDVFDPPFATAAPQGTVVGSDLVAFSEGTRAEVRATVAQWLLFAQLVADKKAANNIEKWMTEYRKVILQSGWTLVEDTQAETKEDSDGFELHQKILSFLSVFLAPVPGAIVIVTGLLKALQEMAADSPWITIFNRRSKRAKQAAFQVTYITDNDDTSTMRTTGFRVEADQSVTQILFFKFQNSNARLYRRSVTFALDAATREALASHIASRVQSFQLDAIKNFDLAV